jgi:hypothetical protein
MNMLRIGFLPSDFNPMLLMLGEQEDLRALSGVLRQFARDGGTVRLDELSFCAARGTRVTLSDGPGLPGLHRLSDTPDNWIWRLDAQRAAAFAEQVDDLAAPSRKAGSELLECSLEEEIPVKVSRGEYTDDFLRN